MIGEITASFETLAEQGPMMAAIYLAEGISRIDQELGSGYAAKNPTLLGLFVLTAAIDCVGSTIAQQVRQGISGAASEISYKLTNTLESLADTIAMAIENS